LKSDAKLVNETLAGDQSAFGLLVQRYERLVRVTVMHICNDRHTAEDIAQEAFFTAFESIGKLQQREKFSGWLLSIAKHKAARHVRAARSREQAVLEARSIDLLGDNRLSSDSTDLLALVERLPDPERVVVGLKHFEGLSVQDIVAWYLSQPTNVYAQMLQALAKAETVHITGWTRQVVRKWPLEAPIDALGGQDAVPGKQPFEAWHWTEADGTPRSYERQGPVVAVRRGGEMREYQEDVDLMFVYSGGYSKDRVSEFTHFGEYFKLLQRPTLVKQELGTRNENGRVLRGIRYIEGNQIQDIWIDEVTGLPERFVRMSKDTGEQTFELQFAVNKRIPNTIADYEPPSTQNMRYDGNHKNTNLAWRRYVQEMGFRLQEKSIDGRVVLLLREDRKTFANQWPLATPNGKYKIVPLDIDQHQPMDFQHFIRLMAASEAGERRHSTWRVPKEFHGFILPRSDLVYEDGTPWREWIAVVLGQFDLELMDVEENRTVWIAKHDGRPLKPWQGVDPPVPYVVEGGVEKKGLVKPGIGFALRPTPLNQLFTDFNRLIDSHDLSADKPWIVDETGLPQPPKHNKSEHGSQREYWEKIVVPEFLVATDSPWFVGEESLQIAREWYLKEFGITFKEVQEPITVHVIRRKQ